jgi:radical SAM protein with 4Fe4S-binding SPASM domain
MSLSFSVSPTVRLNREPYGVVVNNVDLSTSYVVDPLSGYSLVLLAKYGYDYSLEKLSRLIGWDKTELLMSKLHERIPEAFIRIGKYSRDYSFYFDRLDEEKFLYNVNLEDLMKANLGYRISSVPERVYVRDEGGISPARVLDFIQSMSNERRQVPNHLIILGLKRSYFAEHLISRTPDWIFKELMIRWPPEDLEYEEMDFDKITLVVDHYSFFNKTDSVMDFLSRISGRRTQVNYITAFELGDSYKNLYRLLGASDILLIRPIEMEKLSWAKVPTAHAINDAYEKISSILISLREESGYLVYKDRQLVDLSYLEDVALKRMARTVPRSEHRCQAYRTQIAIASSGNVLGCPWIPDVPELSLGNILKEIFREIWSRAGKLAFPEVFEQSSCSDCEYLEICIKYFGFCYAWNSFLFGNILQQDRFCYKEGQLTVPE